MNADVHVDLLEPETNECPYQAYDELREKAPVYFDPRTQMFILTRYDDILMVLGDNARFSNADRRRPDRANPEVLKLYQENGWLPAPTLGVRDEPDHQELRTVFTRALRPKRIRELEAFVETSAHSLIDAFIDQGECDFVKDFAVQLPMKVILSQMGIPDSDLWRIKAWVDAWTRRLRWDLTQEQSIWSVEQEIEAQQYFQPYFDRLRQTPEDTLFSDLVNTEIPNWGRTMNDNELHAEMFSDTFVGAGETAQGAIAHAMQYLIDRPDIEAQLRADPAKIRNFVEELLRLEAPAQGLFRTTTEDVVLHGVTIPAGSRINIRFAAGNRDPEQFECPAEFRLDRPNSRRHLAFSSGTHACLGAALARTEISVSVQAVLQRMSSFRYRDPQPDLHHGFSYVLHALEELPIAFTAAPAA
jgi:cytochrome P450